MAESVQYQHTPGAYEHTRVHDDAIPIRSRNNVQSVFVVIHVSKTFIPVNKYGKAAAAVPDTNAYEDTRMNDDTRSLKHAKLRIIILISCVAAGLPKRGTAPVVTAFSAIYYIALRTTHKVQCEVKRGY